MIEWSVELSEFDIWYELRDFSAGWTLYVDDSSNKTTCGAEVVLEGPGDLLLEQALQFGFKTTNNQVEYKALLVGLNLVYDMGAREKATLEHIHRQENKRSNALSWLSTTKKKSHHRSVMHIWLRQPSMAEAECLAVTNAKTETWMTPIVQCLEHDTCKPKEEKAMNQQCSRYTMINQDLYRRGYSTPLLKCITKDRVEYVLKEIHEGGDCTKYVKKCAKCQELPPTPPKAKSVTQHDISMVIRHLGMDIIGPFTPGKGQTKFLIVGVIYFIKWIEVEPLASISAKNVQNFVWRIHNSLGRTPQTNGHAEATNKVILNELKKQLGKAKSRWTEELLEVLWAYRCTPQTSTQETPYNLTYGTEAMIPVEVGEPTVRRQMYPKP
ncbi:uncharacterized protein [Phaseolus vulgaris]|uniref:uncharacterized protein n=1 Tax=Phaseolus vulgaris TaxID=3885 RepID=UPI0035CB68E9